MNRDWSICLIVAVVCHFGLLYGLQTALNHPARLPPSPAVEVTLIAAPAAVPVAVAPPPVQVPKPLVIPPPPQPIVSKTPDPLPEAKPLAPVIVPVEPVASLTPPAPPAISPVTATAIGDGSSAKPGLDAITAHAQPGERAQPNYAKNPEPLYPLAARRRRQQGLVLLTVKVTSLGRAAAVTLKQSSGFTLLDEAALSAVRDWEFEPARIGPLAVQSEIEVPVRFQLGN